MLEILRDMSKSIARMQDLEVLDKQSNVILEIKEQLKVQGSHEILENQKSNMLEDAPTIQIAFEDQRINEVERIDQRDILVISNKPSLILPIEFVIPGEFKDVKIKAFLFTKMLKDLVQISVVQILILQLFKVHGQVFSNQYEQASIFISRNIKDKIHLKGKGMF